MTKQKAC